MNVYIDFVDDLIFLLIRLKIFFMLKNVNLALFREMFFSFSFKILLNVLDCV